MLIKIEKLLATFSILLMVIFIFSSVFAATDDFDINRDLLENTTPANSGDDEINPISADTETNTSTEANTGSNTSSGNTTNSIGNTSSGNEKSNTTSFDNYTGIADSSTSSTTVSNFVPESGLGLANILNILLIVVGVLLILLAIAILIKLRK